MFFVNTSREQNIITYVIAQHVFNLRLLFADDKNVLHCCALVRSDMECIKVWVYRSINSSNFLNKSLFFIEKLSTIILSSNG